ncbi:MAG: 1-(5-phosphoribosyl)-5-[(5-phosphoribosylamino)methylideneamino] imidazole-4-carboxamide isomerase [Gemmatimonadales bacterium]
MEFYPAIDIRNGRVVRLTQGIAATETMYEEDPVAQAERFVLGGARWIHIVDLDRAFGDGDNIDMIRRLTTRVGSYVQIQLGGGFRNIRQVEAALDQEVARIVIGTAAVTTPKLVPEALKVAGVPRLAVGIDARQGRVAFHGWLETSGYLVDEVARRVADDGVRTIIYTDIPRDGLMGGPDIGGASGLQKFGAGIIANGGVGTLDHLASLQQAGMAGAVVGRALYERRFTVRAAMARLG